MARLLLLLALLHATHAATTEALLLDEEMEEYELEQQRPLPLDAPQPAHPFSLRYEIGSFLRVHCDRTHIHIRLLAAEADSARRQLTREASEKIIAGTLRMGVKKQEGCKAILTTKGSESSWSLTSSYSACGMQSKNSSLGTNYTAKIIFTTPRVVEKMEYDVSCLLPEKEKLNFDARLVLSSLGHTLYPETNRSNLFVRNSQIKAKIRAEDSRFMKNHIFAYPLNCWTTPDAVSAAEEKKQRFYVVRDGCPTFTAEGHPIAAMYQTNTEGDFARYTTMYIHAYEELANRGRKWSNTENPGKFRLACEILVCNGFQHQAVADLPQCPSIGQCEQGTPQRPKKLNSSKWTDHAFATASFPSPLSFYDHQISDPDYSPFLGPVYQPPVHIPPTDPSSTPKAVETPTDWSCLYVSILILMVFGFVTILFLVIWNYAGRDGRRMIRWRLLKSSTAREEAVARDAMMARPLVIDVGVEHKEGPPPPSL